MRSFRYLLNKYDPFGNVERVMFNIGSFFHRRYDTIALTLALLVVPMMAGWAMPVFGAKGISVWTLNKTGAVGALVAGATAQQKQQKLPFRFGTVRRRLTIGTYTLTPGQAIPTITLPQVGMLSRLVVRVQGSYTKANATGLNLLDGYDAILSRSTVKLNNGSAQISDLSGLGISILNKNQSPSLPIKRGLVTTAGAQTFTYAYVIPIAANTREQFTMGLINLQAPELRCTLDLVANPIASVFATAADVTNFLATATVSYEYFEIPNINQYQLPPMTLVRSIEEAPQAIAATGLQTYQIPRLGTMIDYHAVLVLQGVYANVLTNLTEFAWRYNKSDTQYDMLIGDDEVYEADLYGNVGGSSTTFMDPHAINFNLWSAGNRPLDGGDFRDAIDTEENTTTESLITVASGATITGASNIYHVRRVVQRIVQAPAPAAA